MIDWAMVWDAVVGPGARIALILVVLAAAFFLGRVVISRAFKRIAVKEQSLLAKRTEHLRRATIRVLFLVVSFLAVFMVLSEIGINLTAVLAGVGVATLAVSFAAQSIIKDYFNGVLLLLEDWYREGEVARIAGHAGLVEKVTFRRTVLRDLDGFVHSVPNGSIDVATNLTRDWARIHMNISVGYNEDLDHVIRVLNEIGEELRADPTFGPDLLSTPHVERVDNFGDSGIEIKVLGDTKPIKQWALMGEMRKRIKERFDREGIEIPWPHTKVYFGNALSYIHEGK